MFDDKSYESFIKAFPSSAEYYSKDDPNTCPLCGEEYYGCGNNAAPLVDGYCCNQCDMEYVVPARFTYHSMADDPTLRKLMNACCDDYGIISDECESGDTTYRYILAYNKKQYPNYELFGKEVVKKSHLYWELKANHIEGLLSQACVETGYGVFLLEDDQIKVLFNTEEPYRWLLSRTENCPFKRAA